jgi:O-antigen/teichoic acid export membrane protein
VEPPDPQSAAKEIGTAVRHTLVYSIGSLATKAIGFLLMPLYTYYLRPADYGALEVLDLTMSLLSMLLNMGVMAAVLRFYAAASTNREKRQVVGSAFLAMAVTGCCLGALGFLSLGPLASLLFGPAVPAVYIGLSFGAFLLNYVTTVPLTYLRAKEASGTLILLDVISTAVTMALTVYCVAVLKWSLYGVLWSALVVGCVRAPLLILWMVRAAGIGMNWGLLRKMAVFGAPLVFSNLAMFALNFSDRFFLQRLRSLDVVGVYAAGYKFGFLLNFLFIQSFGMMWQARMYIIHRQPDHEKTFAHVLALYFAILSFAALGLSLFGDDIVRVMVDRHYSGAERVIPAVSLAYVFLAVGSFLQLGMFLADKTAIIGKLCAAAAVLSIGLNYVLIGLYGMMGAAWATVAGFAFLAVGSFYCSQRVYPMDLKVGRILRAAAIAIVLYSASLVLGNSGVWVAFGVKLALLALFPAALWMTRFFSIEEVATLGSLRAGVIARARGLYARNQAA